MSWSRNEKIAFISLCVGIIACLAAITVVPEIRRWSGLESRKRVHDVFDAGKPYPMGFERAKLGMRFSVVKILFPNGSFSEDWYMVDLNDDLFYQIAFCCGQAQNDFKVRGIAFYYRGQASKDHVTEEAFWAFGADRVVSNDSQDELIWRDINGVNIYLGKQTYHIVEAGK